MENSSGTNSEPQSSSWSLFALRAGLAFIWLATGFGVLHPSYRHEGTAALARLGLPAWLMVVTCLGEILLGLRVLFGRAATWLVTLQVAMILTFSLILSITQPELLLDPWGRLTKNLPLLVLPVVLWLVEREGWKPRAAWLLRVGMAAPWFVEGVLHKMCLGHVTPLSAFLLRSFNIEATPLIAIIAGGIQTFAALVACMPPGAPGRLALGGQIAALLAVLLLASYQEPLLWVHPFGPLTKNVPWLIGSMVVLWLAREVRPIALR